MKDAFKAAQVEKIAAALKMTFHDFQDEDGVYEVSALVGGQQVALGMDRYRDRAAAQAKAELAELLEMLAFNLRAEVGEVPAKR